MSERPVATQQAIDEFCDTLWLEDGLAKNSLDAYRRLFIWRQRIGSQSLQLGRCRFQRHDAGAFERH